MVEYIPTLQGENARNSNIMAPGQAHDMYCCLVPVAVRALYIKTPLKRLRCQCIMQQRHPEANKVSTGLPLLLKLCLRGCLQHNPPTVLRSSPYIRMQPFRGSSLLTARMAGWLLVLLLLQRTVAALPAGCTTAASFQSGTSGCPTAADAVALLLGNNNEITAYNQVCTGNCVTTLGGINQMGLVTDFGSCHYLKDTFTSGRPRLC